MNDLMVINVQNKKEDTFDKEAYRALQQKKIMNWSDLEDYITQNVIETSLCGANGLEEYDLEDIVASIIKLRGQVDSETMVQEINDYNEGVISQAIEALQKNIGLENFVKMVKDRWGRIFDGDWALEKAEESARIEVYEMLFRGMHETYFPKIVSFCAYNNVELVITEQGEIIDVLYFAGILNVTDRFKKLLLPNIHQAILFSPLNALSEKKAFIMGDVLYVPRELMVGGYF